MQYFKSAKNPYLKDSALKVQKPYSHPVFLQANPHGRQGSFLFDKTIDELSQTFLSIEYTITPIATADRGIQCTYLGFKTFDNLYLETVSGKVELMCLKPAYNIWKYEQLKGTPIYSMIQKGLTPDVNFLTTGTCTLKIPLFMFYSENPDAFLSIRNLEDLQLRFEVASAADLGIWLYDTSGDDPVALNVLPLTSLKVSLIQESFNKDNTSLMMFQNNTNIANSKFIKNSYNVFYEENVVLAAGSTSHNLLLRCPFPLPVLVGMIYNSKNRAPITSFSLKVRNDYIVKDIPVDTNYSLYDKSSGYQETMYLEYWVNRVHEILSNTGLITWSPQDGMAPTVLEINYPALDEDYNLHVFSPYITYQSVNEKGRIGINDTDDVSNAGAKLYDLQNPMSGLHI